MSLSLSDRLAAVKPKMQAARLRVEGEADPKPLGEQLGAAIARALLLANLTKQEVSYAMGYTDQSSISKWIAGKEPPRFDKLWMVVALRPSLVVALGELAEGDVHMSVIFRRRA